MAPQSARSAAAVLIQRRLRRSSRNSIVVTAIGVALTVVGTLQALPLRASQPHAFAPLPHQLGRRELAAQLGMAMAGLWAGTAGPLLPEEPVLASGGSTAGKYSTIPSAKRRFYGRVRQGIYKFLQMEPVILKGDLTDPVIDDFFAKNIIKQKGGERIKGCEFADCITKEKRTSRWLDFKAASDLLASAFRYDASDVPRDLPQVKVIRAYAKKVEKLKKAIEAGEVEQVQKLYKQAKTDLSNYIPMVELNPISSDDYTHEWDTAPEVWCQGQFCV